MRKTLWFVAVVSCLGALALAALPPEKDIQGMYAGTWTDAKGAKGTIEARVVALGDYAFKVYLYLKDEAGKQVRKVVADAKRQGDALPVQGGGCRGSIAGGVLEATIEGGCKLQAKRFIPKSPTLGKKPPEGAIVLLDGKNFDEVVFARGNRSAPPSEWKPLPDGSIVVPKGGFRSKRAFSGSYDLHVEFMCNFKPKARSQGRGNSGVFLNCGQEIQVLDSFGMTTYKGGGCGGLYKWKNPDAFDEFSLASYPPLVWQTYDIEYRVPRGPDGRPLKPRLTVYHNGIKIHENVELRRNDRRGQFFFQDHGNPIRYRNIWVLPLGGK